MIDSIILNKRLVKHLGIEKAFFLTLLINKIGENKITTWNQKEIEEDTWFKKRVQMRIIKELKEQNILSTKNMWVPSKRYFEVNDEEISKIIFQPNYLTNNF